MLGMPLDEAKKILGGMDGKVIFLQYRAMTFRESESILDVLAEKYGEPTRTVQGTALTGRWRDNPQAVAAVYRGSETGDELIYDPWWATPKGTFRSLAKVRLVDHTRYDLQFKQRRAGVYTKSNAKSDL